MPDMPGLNVLNAFNNARGLAMQEGTSNLQQVGALQGILAKVREQQQTEAYRSALADLGPAPSTEQLGVLAARFGGPKDILAHADRVSGQKVTQEMARSRLTQALQVADMVHQDRMRTATTAEARAAESARHNGVVEAIQRDAITNAGARLAYDTGATPANSAPVATPVSGTAPTQQWGPMAAGTPQPVQDAATQIRQNLAQGGPGGSIDLGVLPQPQAAPASPQQAPAAPAIPADPNNLDARDLGAGARGPVMGNAPAATPVQTITPSTTALPTMPPEIASAPRRVQDQWKLAEAKAATASQLTPEAITSAAARYRIDGTLPPNLGRGGNGAANMAKILNEAAASAKAEGNTPEAQRLTQIAGHANTQALNVLSSQETKMRAFEGTFRKNADLVEYLSSKVDRTGTPVVNRWIQAGQRSIAGDADLVAFDAAVKGAVNEYAKIVSSATGSGVTAEGEIKKIEEILSTKQTKEQVISVLNTLRKETQNRMDAFSEEKQRLISSIGPRSAAAPSAGGIREFATEAEASAAGLAPGTKIKIGGVQGTWH